MKTIYIQTAFGPANLQFFYAVQALKDISKDVID